MGCLGGTEPVSSFDSTVSRFFSEYGYQSFPEYRTVLKYAPNKKDHDIYSDVLLSHQRGGSNANKRIETYMLKEYRKPLDFEKFLHVGMLLQGDAIKIAIESHRRNMPYCMGSLFWQHNDCWPVASWSSRDYYGNWKAQHYFAKKAFKDILVTSTIKDNKLDVYCVSDRLIPSNGILEVTSMTLDGKVVYSERKLVTVDSNSSKLISEYDLNLLKKSYDNNNLMVYLKLFVDGIDYDNIRLLSSNKDLNLLKPDISVDFEDKDCAIELILSSKVFVRGVYLSIPDANYFFEDNYFDIVPGLEKKVLLKTDKSVDYLKKYLKITSLFDSYNN